MDGMEVIGMSPPSSWRAYRNQAVIELRRRIVLGPRTTLTPILIGVIEQAQTRSKVRPSGRRKPCPLIEPYNHVVAHDVISVCLFRI